jgi:hypothetical protein
MYSAPTTLVSAVADLACRGRPRGNGQAALQHVVTGVATFCGRVVVGCVRGPDRAAGSRIHSDDAVATYYVC